MKVDKEPLWAAWLSVASLLYAIWASKHMYQSDPGLQNGVGIMVSWLFIPFIFCLTLAIAGVVFGMAFHLIKAPSTRIILLLVAFGVFFFGYGKPSILVIAVALATFPFAYFRAKKAGKDETDLEEFMKK